MHLRTYSKKPSYNWILSSWARCWARCRVLGRTKPALENHGTLGISGIASAAVQGGDGWASDLSLPKWSQPWRVGVFPWFIPKPWPTERRTAEARSGQLKLLNSTLTGGTIACHVSLTRSLAAVSEVWSWKQQIPMNVHGTIVHAWDATMHRCFWS